MKRAFACFLLLPLFSCAKSENISTFTIELATVSMDGSCTESEEPLPVNVTCVSVSLCKREGATCTPQPLYRSTEDHGGPGAESIRLGRLSAATFALDTRTTSGQHEIHVVAYDESGHVFATGATRDVTLDGAPVRVRLQRADAWSCGPTHAESAEPLQSRALHAATALPNGDVLIYGGVSGDAVDVAGFATGAQGASLERTVEVYDASEDRFYTASVSDSLGFGRVFFASELATPSDDPPPYRIHIFGGYSVATGAVLRVDGSQSSAANATGMPFVPTSEASPAESVTLVYDPISHRVDVEPLGGTGGFTTGFPATTGFIDDINPSLLITGAGPFMGATSQTTLSDEISWIGREGAPVSGAFPSLAQGRAGGTVSVFPNAPGSALVWGGNIGNATIAEARSRAGELVRLSFSTVNPVAGGNSNASECGTMVNGVTGVPEPTVFHTATTIDGGIVVAGGLFVGATDCPMQGVRTTYNNDGQPITIFSIEGTTITADRVLPGDFVGTAFHSATRLDANRVLLVGGAFSGTLDSVPIMPLTAFDQVGIVGPGHTSTDGFLYAAQSPLLRARFGHATALLPGGRVLVTGGFERYMAGASAKLRAMGAPEVIQLGVSEPNLEGAQCDDEPFVSM